MATFYVIRYNRDLMKSELFPSIYGNGMEVDSPHLHRGTYQGKGPDVTFEHARFMTSKEADKLIKHLVGHRFPREIMDKIAVEVMEPQ